jgi:O-antigen biosynthesis protein WbqP
MTMIFRTETGPSSPVQTDASDRGTRFPHRPGKRAADLLLAGTALVFLSPLLITVWILVRATSKGPGLFWSERVGRGGALFKMPKLRTMRVDAPVQRREDIVDPRRFDTPIGHFLRVSSIDELPQLWCVLKGNMSLVGPRPVLPSDRTAVERQRLGCPLRVRPGITGIAQIRGRNTVAPTKKARYDAVYARRHTVWVDLAIMWKTVRYVLRRRDIM